MEDDLKILNPMEEDLKIFKVDYLINTGWIFLKF